MSEHRGQHHEGEPAVHNAEHNSGEEAKHVEKQAPNAEADRARQHETLDDIETIRSSIEHEAETGKKQDHVTNTDEHERTSGSVFASKSIKKDAYKKELTKVRSHLSKPEKRFSKFVHAPSVERVSEFGSKTVARPSGLLGSGVITLVGTSALVWISSHYGFRYNYFMFVILLVGGYFVGLLVEAFIRILRVKRS